MFRTVKKVFPKTCMLKPKLQTKTAILAVVFLTCTALTTIPAAADSKPTSTTLPPTTTTTPPSTTTTIPPSTTTTVPPVSSPPPSGPTTTRPDITDPIVPPPPVPPPLDVEAIARLVEFERAQAVAAAQERSEQIQRINQARIDRAATAVDTASLSQQLLEDKLSETKKQADILKEKTSEAKNKLRNAGVEAFSVKGSANDPTFTAPRFVDPDAIDTRDRSVLYYAAAFDVLATDLNSAEKDYRQAVNKVDRAQEKVNQAHTSVAKAQQSLETAKSGKRQSDEEAQANIEAAASTGNVPSSNFELTVLGDSLVPASDMAAFVYTRGRPSLLLDIDLLAETFIKEGEAEGVRGDVAFMQSILETGWFSYSNSMVAPLEHNYAGIGACDSCSGGFRFKSPTDGVRSQIQLLKTYATPGLKTEDLANPPSRLTPEKSSVRGCCSTWMELSGVWATGPGYGSKILKLYNDLLAFSVARHKATPALTSPPS